MSLKGIQLLSTVLLLLSISVVNYRIVMYKKHCLLLIYPLLSQSFHLL